VVYIEVILERTQGEWEIASESSFRYPVFRGNDGRVNQVWSRLCDDFDSGEAPNIADRFRLLIVNS